MVQQSEIRVQATPDELDYSDLTSLSDSLATSKTVSTTALDATELQALQTTMGEMLIERFNYNMEVFKKYLPNIYERFINYKPSEPLEFICSSNGIPNLYFPQSQKFFYQSDNPLELCKQQAELCLKNIEYQTLRFNSYNSDLAQIHLRYLQELIDNHQGISLSSGQNTLEHIKSAPLVTLIGCGLGYHIGFLFEKVDIANLILIEPNSDLFFASLYASDWASLLEYLHSEQRGIYLIIGKPSSEIITELSYFYEQHGNMLVGFNWTMVHYRSEQINTLITNLEQDYSYLYEALGFSDDSLFALSHVIHNIANGLPYIRKGTVFPPEFSSMPLCIVANGPSLSKDIAVLRQIQDKVLILACGSALEALYNAGIQATMFVASERVPHVLENFAFIPDREYKERVFKFALDMVHPSAKEILGTENSAVVANGNEVSFDLLNRYFPQLYGQVASCRVTGPSVSNYALTLMTNMGMQEIYLFGMDNGNVIDTKQPRASSDAEAATRAVESNQDRFYPQHNNFSSYYAFLKNSSTSKLTAITGEIVLEGNFGDKVHSSPLFLYAIKYANFVLKNAKAYGMQCFNCSAGARIEEAQPLRSSELLKRLANAPVLAKENFIDFLREHRVQLDKSQVAKIKASLHKDTMPLILERYLKLIHSQTTRGFNSRSDAVTCLQKLCELNHFISKSSEFVISRILQGSLSLMSTEIMAALYQNADEKQALTIFKRDLEIFCYFIEDLQECCKYLPDYIAGENEKYFAGRIGRDHPKSLAPLPDVRARVSADAAKHISAKFEKRYS